MIDKRTDNIAEKIVFVFCKKIRQYTTCLNTFAYCQSIVLSDCADT